MLLGSTLTSNDAVQIKPVYPMKMKFDDFEMSEFFLFYFVFPFFNSFFAYYVVLIRIKGG